MPAVWRAEPGAGLPVAGIDVGSSAIKSVVLVDHGGDRPAVVLASLAERIRRRDAGKVARDVFEACLAQAGLTSDDLAYVATTGEGEVVSFRTGHFYGMTAHARGALHLHPAARAALDIGALHTRAVVMDERARVGGCRMTSQCASGTGQFLENICRYLGITLEEIGDLSLQADAPESCSSICAVLAETDVINMVSRGISTPNIIRGIHESMAGRCARLVTSLGAAGDVVVTGGLASDAGLLGALNAAATGQKSAYRFVSHRDSVLAGALGAALWGAFRFRRLAGRGITLEEGLAS